MVRLLSLIALPLPSRRRTRRYDNPQRSCEMRVFPTPELGPTLELSNFSPILTQGPKEGKTRVVCGDLCLAPGRYRKLTPMSQPSFLGAGEACLTSAKCYYCSLIEFS